MSFIFSPKTTMSKTFKIVKPLENGYLVQELILTKQGENLVKDLTENGMSND